MKINIRSDEYAAQLTAASEAGQLLSQAVSLNQHARLLICGASSLSGLLSHLTKEDIPWNNVSVFYAPGYSPSTPLDSRLFLHEHLTDIVTPEEVTLIDSYADGPSGTDSLERLVAASPMDVALVEISPLGELTPEGIPHDLTTTACIGSRGPDLSALRENESVIDASLLPQHNYLTMHIFTLCRHVLCPMTGSSMTQTVRNMLFAPEITSDVPATMLRTHPDWRIYLDSDAASLIDPRLSVPR